jgi:alcohol dehydrogenase (NADP+)
MGVKLGAALGAEVTVLSQSLKKMEDGLRLGASHYYATADRDTFRNLRSSFDLILNTVSANLNLGDYLNLLDVDGTLVELGIPEHPMEVPAFPLALARRSLSGSNIGGIAETQEMLNFCAEHNVTPEIEVIEPDYVNEAYERVLASDVRYRFVIDTSTL